MTGIPKTPDDELHVILMNFRNAIQADRDRLYKTHDATVEWIKKAHKEAEARLKAREQWIVKEAYENGYDDRTLEADHELEDAVNEARIRIDEISQPIHYLVSEHASDDFRKGFEQALHELEQSRLKRIAQLKNNPTQDEMKGGE